ncbi:MAG TPA: trehalose-6-phosphate synthase [Thermomicrobiales bacterium]|nr:trehalose-6-phosphate synthase [Thermomicrobiales bacterium]
MTGTEDTGVNRLVVVSNRLPVVLAQAPDGRVTAQPGSGGLISAIAPALRNRGGIWIGWPGTGSVESIRPALDDASRGTGYALEPVELSAELIAGYYYGFSNEIIWPLFHDLPSRCNFVPRYWRDYQAANRVFAEAIERVTVGDDFVWVHDYHLMDVAEQLHNIGARRRTGFFLHIPFPPVDLFLKLPWRFEVLRGLMEFDVLGFQTARDTRNFVHCVRTLLPNATVSGRRSSYVLQLPGNRTVVGSFPIGIDARDFEEGARSDDVLRAMQLSLDRLPNMKMILGIDRLDYTKGVPERLVAFQETLRAYPELQGCTTLIQVVVPSREDVPEYQILRSEVERLVGEVNGEFTQPGWVPIHYIYRPLDRTELLAYYRMSDVCVVTPLKDGMNLVSKEYCACNVEGDGVLILSEFAGSAAQLHRGAIMVNPHDIEGTARAIHQAVTMPIDERRSRMRRLKSVVRRDDIFWWTDMYLRAAISKRLDDFLTSEYFVPRSNLEDRELDEPGESRG